MFCVGCGGDARNQEHKVLPEKKVRNSIMKCEGNTSDHPCEASLLSYIFPHAENSEISLTNATEAVEFIFVTSKVQCIGRKQAAFNNIDMSQFISAFRTSEMCLFC